MQEMAAFHRPHLVIFDDKEVNYDEGNILGLVVILKTNGPYVIDHAMIQSAVYQQTSVFIEMKQISKYLCDYVLFTGNPTITTKILRSSFIKIDDSYLSLLPLTINYGSIEVDINSTLPSYQTQPSQPIMGNQEPLRLNIVGLPPVFWYQSSLIPRIFKNICVVRDIRVKYSNMEYTMLTYACRSAIPPVMDIGIIRNGSKLHMWQIWINVQPAEPMDPHADQAIGNCSYNKFLLQ